MILQNHLADCLLLILVYCFTQYCKPFLIVCKRLFKTGCDSLDILFTFLLLVREYGLFHLCRRNNLFDCCKKLFRNGTALVCVLWLAALSYNCIDKFNNFLVNVMGLKDRLKHDIFRNLIGSSIMITFSLVEATVRAKSESFFCRLVGFTINSPSISPICVVAQGPSKGMSEMQVAIAAPSMAVYSGLQSGSTERTRLFSVTSFL